MRVLSLSVLCLLLLISRCTADISICKETPESFNICGDGDIVNVTVGEPYDVDCDDETCTFKDPVPGGTEVLVNVTVKVNDDEALHNFTFTVPFCCPQTATLKGPATPPSATVKKEADKWSLESPVEFSVTVEMVNEWDCNLNLSTSFTWTKDNVFDVKMGKIECEKELSRNFTVELKEGVKDDDVKDVESIKISVSGGILTCGDDGHTCEYLTDTEVNIPVTSDVVEICPKQLEMKEDTSRDFAVNLVPDDKSYHQVDEGKSYLPVSISADLPCATLGDNPSATVYMTLSGHVFDVFVDEKQKSGWKKVTLGEEKRKEFDLLPTGDVWAWDIDFEAVCKDTKKLNAPLWEKFRVPGKMNDIFYDKDSKPYVEVKAAIAKKEGKKDVLCENGASGLNITVPVTIGKFSLSKEIHADLGVSVVGLEMNQDSVLSKRFFLVSLKNSGPDDTIHKVRQTITASTVLKHKTSGGNVEDRDTTKTTLRVLSQRDADDMQSDVESESLALVDGADCSVFNCKFEGDGKGDCTVEDVTVDAEKKCVFTGETTLSDEWLEEMKMPMYWAELSAKFHVNLENVTISSAEGDTLYYVSSNSDPITSNNDASAMSKFEGSAYVPPEDDVLPTDDSSSSFVLLMLLLVVGGCIAFCTCTRSGRNMCGGFVTSVRGWWFGRRRGVAYSEMRISDEEMDVY